MASQAGAQDRRPGRETRTAGLIRRWVGIDSQRPDEPRIKRYGVEVWALVGYAKGADCDVAETARAYEVPEKAVEAALAYYGQHPALIDARLEVNAVADAR